MCELENGMSALTFTRDLFIICLDRCLQCEP